MVNWEIPVRLGDYPSVLVEEAFNVQGTYSGFGARLHLQRYRGLASVECHTSDPDPRVEISVRKIKRTKAREISIEGASVISWTPRPDAGNPPPDFEFLEHILQCIRVERRISSEPHFPDPIFRSCARTLIPRVVAGRWLSCTAPGGDQQAQEEHG